MRRYFKNIFWVLLLSTNLVIGVVSTANAVPGDLKWSVPAYGNIGSSVAINPQYDYRYVGSADHYIYAYSSNGELQWRYKTNGYIGSSPTVSEDGTSVYVGSYDGNVYAVNALTGEEAWRFQTAGEIYSSPALSSDGVLYIGSADGSVYSIDAISGAVRWQYDTGTPVLTSPSVGIDGAVYVGLSDGFLYALSGEVAPASRVLWAHQLSLTAGAMSASVIANDRLYIGTFSNELLAIDLDINSTQREIWRVGLGGRVASSPAIDNAGTIYVATYDTGTVYSIDPVAGNINGSFATGSQIYSSPAVAGDGTVFIGAFDGNFYALTPSQTDFTVKWSSLLDGAVVASPTFAVDAVYIVSKDSSLYAFEYEALGGAGSNWPMFGGDNHHSRVATQLSAVAVADAGADQSVAEQTQVTLDGSGTSGGTTYAWRQIVGPEVVLSDAAITMPTFTAPGVAAVTVLAFELVVSDSEGVSSPPDTVMITVNPVDGLPIANAGPDQTLNDNYPGISWGRVNLNGYDSTDSDGSVVTYTWTQVGGPAVTLEDSMPARAYTKRFDMPTVNEPTDYIFELMVTDNDGNTSLTADTVVITITPENTPPVADAGPDRYVHSGDADVSFFASSVDIDGNITGSSWVQTGGPTVALLQSGGQNEWLQFAIPDVTVDTDLTFELTVTDNQGASSLVPDAMVITVSPANIAPIASAGPDLNVNAGDLVTLNGAADDVDGSIISYNWYGAQASLLTGADTATPSFIAPSGYSSLSFSLMVQDNDWAYSPIDYVLVNINQPPNVTNARESTAVDSLLNGVLTATDADGDVLTYSLDPENSGLPGSTVVIDSATGAYTYTPPPGFNGRDSFKFFAHDGSIYSEAATITIDVGGPLYDWSRVYGDETYIDSVSDIALDSQGNVYLVGSFYGTIDLDPTDGIDDYPPVGRNDCYLTKINSNGSYGGAMVLEDGVCATSVAIDESDNIYLTGSYSFDPATANGVDLDPTNGTDIHAYGTTEAYEYGGFVTKLTADGSYVWSHAMSGHVGGNDIAIAPDGSLYVAGTYRDADFAPERAGGQYTLGSHNDFFLMKLDPEGDFQWVYSAGGVSSDVGSGVAVDNDGNAYLIGGFYDEIDFDPSSGVDSYTASSTPEGFMRQDVFVTKILSGGGYGWTRVWGGNSSTSEQAKGIVFDGENGLYIVGEFAGPVDFDPTDDGVDFQDGGNAGAYLSKLYTDGNYAWARTWVSDSYILGKGVAISVTGDILVGGAFVGESGVDFDPGEGVDIRMTESANSDAFLISMTAEGSYTGAWIASGIRSVETYHVAAAADRSIYYAGKYSGSDVYLTDLNPGDGTDFYTSLNGSNGWTDMFLTRLGAANPNEIPVADAGLDQIVDERALVTLSGSGSDSDGTVDAYSWRQTTGPLVHLSDPAITSPVFSAPIVTEATAFTFALVVTDNIGRSSVVDEVVITVNPVNALPVVNAGIDQTADELVIVTLEGSGSDSDGSIANYLWSQTTGPVVLLSDSGAARVTFETPIVPAVTAFTFELLATDNEGGVSLVDEVVVTVIPQNPVPIPNAGPDQSVDEQTLVTLSGSGTDNGTIVGYSWVQTDGTVVTLSDATSTSPTFTAPTVTAVTPLTFELVLTDNEGGVSFPDSVVITVNPVNALPDADAGPDQSVNEHVMVTLSGAGTDSDGVISDYLWSQTGGPAVTLSDAAVASPTFAAPVVISSSTLTFELVVVDNEGGTSLADVVTIIVNPVPDLPVAVPGQDRVVNEGAVVILDGSGSYDLDDEPITNYAWSQVDGPSVTLTGADTATASFTVPIGNNVTFQLTVTDSGGSVSLPAQVVLTINDAPIAYTGGANTVENSAVNGLLGARDADGDTLTYALDLDPTGQLALGSVSIDPNTGAYTYTPNTGVTGTDNFRFIVSDGVLNSNIATVFVTVREPPPANADYSYDYAWSNPFGGASEDYVKDVATDTAGNIYVVGHFRDTVDFDPDVAGDDSITAVGGFDVFVTKHNADGSYGWTKTFGGSLDDRGQSVALDVSGNIYLTGIYNGTVDFDPDAVGVRNYTASNANEIYVIKLSADGSYGWTRVIVGSTSAALETTPDITVDNAGGVVVSGVYAGSVDFDVAGTGDIHSSINGTDDIFITKIYLDGGYGWTRTFGSDWLDEAHAIAVDDNNNIYVAGNFYNTVDFDAGPGNDNHTTVGASDIFLAQYLTDGSYGWARTFGSETADYGRALAVGDDGELYVGGLFRYYADFDPGPGWVRHDAVGNTYDAFVSKFWTDGSYEWTRTWGNSSYNTYVNDIAIGKLGDLFVGGTYLAITDFDPNAGEAIYGSNGLAGYMSHFKSNGNYGWTQIVDSAGDDAVHGIAVDPVGNLIEIGRYAGWADFDPGPADDSYSSNGNVDAYIRKWNFSLDSDSDGYADAVDAFPNDPTEWLDTDGDLIGNNADLDDDGDGMSDSYEQSYGLDPLVDDAANDNDGDGLANLQEYQLGTDPTVADSDGDGMSDGFENTYLLDPLNAADAALDGDGDGYTNLEEFQNGTDPTVADAPPSSAYSYAWSYQFAGSSWDRAKDVATDAAGNVYVFGFFSGTVDFDNGVGVDSYTSAGWEDAYITKLNADGSYGWTKVYSGSLGVWPEGIAIDTVGNLYMTGFYNTPVDFDPGPGVDTYSPVSYHDYFVTKLNSDGSYGWTRVFPGNSINYQVTSPSVAVDGAGNVVVAGHFANYINLDAVGAGDVHSSSGSSDIFIVKLGGDGSYQWGRSVGSSGAEEANGVAIDSSNNIYVAGHFSGTVDFDGGSGIDDHTAAGGQDSYVVKYLPDGSYGWARTFGAATAFDYAYDVSVGDTGAVYVVGRFQGTADFDPGIGVDEHIASTNDGYLTKLWSDGSYGWTRIVGSGGDTTVYGVEVGNLGDVFVAGKFSSTTDFDPTVSVDNYSAVGGSDAFLAHYKPDGSYVWTQPLGSSYDDDTYGIAVDSSGSVYEVGTVMGTGSVIYEDIDYDPGPGVDSYQSRGRGDGYIRKWDTN